MIKNYFLSLSISFYLSTPENRPMRVGSGTLENTPIVGRNTSKHPYSPAGPLNTLHIGNPGCSTFGWKQTHLPPISAFTSGKDGGKSPPWGEMSSDKIINYDRNMLHL